MLMNKSTIYILIIVLLVVCNGILGFLLFSKPAPPAPPEQPYHKPPREVVAEKLNFSEEQIQAYDKLIEEHKSKVKAIDMELHLLKKSLFTSILQENTELLAEEVASQIANMQKKIELLHVQHLLDVKALCNPDQQAGFEEVIKEFPKIFGPPHHKKPLHPNGHPPHKP